MTKIVCETATLADAVTKAARVAPTKGHAYDKARGIILDLHPDKLKIKATDLETTYLQRVAMVSSEIDEPVAWRLPSHLLAGIMSSLPPTGEITLESSNNSDVTLRHNKVVAKLRVIVDDTPYPIIKAFDPKGMATVNDFGDKMQQVDWATDESSPILSGVHIDGESLIACNRASLPTVPCTVPVEEPITVLAKTVVPLLRSHPTIKLRAVERRLQLMTDDDTQITVSILEGKFPKVDAIKRDEFQGIFNVNRVRFHEGLERMLVLGRGERYPKVKLSIGMDTIKYGMDIPELGRMTDEIPITHKIGERGHEKVWGEGETYDIWFDPNNIIRAMDNAKGDVTFKYGPKGKPLNIVADDFSYWGMELRPTPKDEAKADA